MEPHIYGQKSLGSKKARRIIVALITTVAGGVLFLVDEPFFGIVLCGISAISIALLS
jgi:hypothetical protein